MKTKLLLLITLLTATFISCGQSTGKKGFAGYWKSNDDILKITKDGGLYKIEKRWSSGEVKSQSNLTVSKEGYMWTDCCGNLKYVEENDVILNVFWENPTKYSRIRESEYLNQNNSESDKFLGTWKIDEKGILGVIKVSKENNTWKIVDIIMEEESYGKIINGKLVYQHPTDGIETFTVTLELVDNDRILTTSKMGKAYYKRSK
jgi:hypothetical protein